MAELVDHLAGAQCDPEVQQVGPAEELLEFGQLRRECFEVDCQQDPAGEHKQQCQRHRDRVEQPADERVHPGQDCFGVPAGKPDVQQASHGVEQLLLLFLEVELCQRGSLADAVGKDQSLLMQVGDQVLDIGQLKPDGGQNVMKVVPEFFQVTVAVEQLQGVVLFGL